MPSARRLPRRTRDRASFAGFSDVHSKSLFFTLRLPSSVLVSRRRILPRAQKPKTSRGITFQMFPRYTDPNQQPWLRHKASDVEHQVSKDPVIVRQEDLQAAIEPGLI